MSFEQFSDEQARVLVNLQQQYRGWIAAERILENGPYGLKIKDRHGIKYLYETSDRNSNGKSLGRLDEDKEAYFRNYHETKDYAKARSALGRETLNETCRIYRALGLPVLASEAGQLLRQADRQNILGSHIMVVGTNAMAAYAIEANGFLRGTPDETKDFDIAWTARVAEDGAQVIWNMLKAVDKTYTINTERPFQALNSKLYEVEVLVAPSRSAGMFRTDKPIPIPLPEQEWLLNGKFVDHVVVCRDGSPARIVAPDPRWYALQKLWMAQQEKRNPQKRPKDEKQGMAILNVVAHSMPQFPLGSAFEIELPDELVPHFARWKEQYVAPPRPRW